jgi:hypothetical protein
MSHALRRSLSNLWVYLSVSVFISVVLWVVIGMVLSGDGVVSSTIQGAACGLAVGVIMYHSQYGSET